MTTLPRSISVEQMKGGVEKAVDNACREGLRHQQAGKIKILTPLAKMTMLRHRRLENEGSLPTFL